MSVGSQPIRNKLTVLVWAAAQPTRAKDSRLVERMLKDGFEERSV